MDTTKDNLKLNWNMLKPKMRAHWGKLTEDDVAHLAGSSEELISVLRKRYGYGKAQAEIELNTWLSEQVDQTA